MNNIALQIARETLAKHADNRGAPDTASRYRVGHWDDSTEMQMAVLVATAALETCKLTLSRSKIFIGVLLDEIAADASDVNISVSAGGVEKARVELSDVLADIERLTAD